MPIPLPKRLIALLSVLAAASLAATACGGVDTGGASEKDSPITVGATTTGETTLTSEPDAASSPSPTDPGGCSSPGAGSRWTSFPCQGWTAS